MELTPFTILLTNPLLRWIFWLSVTVLNFFAFVHDPIRFSEQADFFGIPDKWFIYIARMMCLTLDILTFLGLWFTIPLFEGISVYWFIPLVFLGYAFISQVSIDSPTVSKEEEHFSPPPEYLWPKSYRIVLFIAILLLNITIFMQFYIASGISDYYNNTVLHRFFLQRFGGFYKGNYLAFIVAWLGILSFIFDSNMLRRQYEFQACQYDLPNSWNF